MRYRYHNRNAGLSPMDPAFDGSYDADEDYDRYLDACEDRADEERTREFK